MLGSIVGAIAALIFALLCKDPAALHDVNSVNAVFIITGALFLYLAYTTKARAWATLLRVEEDSFPYAQELFLRDKALYFGLFSLFVFTLYSFFVVLIQSLSITSSVLYMLVVVWIFLAGVAFDVVQFTVRRMMHYSYYPFLLRKVVNKCLYFVAHGKEGEAFEWLDALIEVIGKSARKGSSHIANFALDQVLVIIEGYVGAAGKSLRIDPLASSKTSFLDRVNYTSLYVCKRLEWIFRRAIFDHTDPVADEVLSVFGKMSIYFTKYHPTLAHLPLLFIEKCAKFAVDHDQEDLAVRASAMMSELAKNYIQISKERNISLNEIILKTFASLEEIVKATFQKNRETSPALLMQPFAEIGQFLGEEGMNEFPGREDILKELRRVLGQFSALDAVKLNVDMPK